jgi:hypothetical protein
MIDLFAFAARVERIQDAFAEKMPQGNGSDFEVRLNYTSTSPVYFHTGFGQLPEDFPAGGSFDSEDELEAYLNQLEAFIEAMPTREVQAQRLAARDLGRAIDHARETGLEVDAIAESFAGVWENLLPSK